MHEYWTEQLAYRQSILSLHKAAEKEQMREASRKRESDIDGRSVLSGSTYTSSDAPSEASSIDRYRRQRRGEHHRGQSEGSIRYGG